MAERVKKSVKAVKVPDLINQLATKLELRIMWDQCNCDKHVSRREGLKIAVEFLREQAESYRP